MSYFKVLFLIKIIIFRTILLIEEIEFSCYAIRMLYCHS